MGPSPKMFDTFDYLVWLLSKASNWMPARTKDYLLQGFREWTVWQWHAYPETDTDLQISSSPAALFRSMTSARKASSFVLKPEAAADLRHRIAVARVLLDLPDPAEDLEIAFLNGKFIEWYIEEQSLDRKRATRRRPRTARE